MNKKVICPYCEKESELSNSNPHRPFCSERCQLIDLGQWIEESYTIRETSTPDSDTKSAFLQKH